MRGRSPPGRACGRAVPLRLGSETADTSWRLSRTRPLHEIAHRSWQFMLQLARTVENLARDVCADIARPADRKSTRLNSSHITISYAVFCLKKKKKSAIIHTAIRPLADTGQPH